MSAAATLERTRLLVKDLLSYPYGRKWTVSGLGFMRLYLSDNVRLHVWDKRLKVPGVSPIHTHPWHFESYVVAGKMGDLRYLQTPKGQPASRVTIVCGAEACTTSEPELTRLLILNATDYNPGDTYGLAASHIHMSSAIDGTVTIITREPTDDPDHADVFWFGSGGWVDAQVRPAKDMEVAFTCRKALALL